MKGKPIKPEENNSPADNQIKEENMEQVNVEDESNDDKDDDYKKDQERLKVIQIISAIIRYITYAWQDIVFGIFMAFQELDDTSFLVTLENRAVFDKDALVAATIYTHLLMNVVIVFIAGVVAMFVLTRRESRLFGILSIWLIVAYEFLFHVLKLLIVYLTPVDQDPLWI